MTAYYPGYYDQFHCIASACPDSCCKEWAVDVDSASAAYYRFLTGALGDSLRSVLQDTEDGTIMTIRDGRCPMWREDGLCRIHAELGHDALCKTCRDFPRLTHDYGDFVEYGLELSCPEAARLILTASAQDFISQTQANGSAGDYDPEIMKILLESRKAVLDFLKCSNHTLPENLSIILLYGHSVQAQLDGGAPAYFDPEACLDVARQHAGSGDWDALFAFFGALEILTEQWRTRLQTKPVPVRWNGALRNLMCYMVQRYWLQTISDYDLVCRVKLAIIACLLVGALGGDTIETAQLFSKEIENDPDNIEAILDGAYSAHALTDANIISLLLG